MQEPLHYEEGRPIYATVTHIYELPSTEVLEAGKLVPAENGMRLEYFKKHAIKVAEITGSQVPVSRSDNQTVESKVKK
jgi:hypothetical protein